MPCLFFESRAVVSSPLNGGYMTKRLSLIVAVFAILVTSAIAQTSPAKRTIQVDINYTGAGLVDSNHKIYVALWDTADVQGAEPVTVKSLDSKKGTVTFAEVQKVPAYVSVAFDPTGGWTAESAPPRVPPSACTARPLRSLNRLTSLPARRSRSASRSTTQ
jgi:hypothetical protein